MKVTEKTRSLTLTLAHAIRKRNPSMTFGEVQVQSWKVMRLINRMKDEAVNFSFRKVNGEMRKAVGKLTYSLDNLIMKGGDDKPLANIRFFDLTKDEKGEPKGWRSFRVELVE